MQVPQFPAPDPEQTREHIRTGLLSGRITGATLEAILRGADHTHPVNAFGFDRDAGLEYLWDLARWGALAVLVGPGPASGQEPHVRVTEFGRRVLAEEPPASLYASTRYLSQLRRVTENPDPIVLSYIEEAIGALRNRLYRSSAVMLGCACERLVVMLAEAIATANVPPYSVDLGKMLKRITGISEVFEKVRGALTALDQDHKIPRELADVLDRRVTSIFDHARVLRNRSGHPTGATVSADEAEAGLIVFPGFHESVSALIGAVKALPTAAT